MRPSTANAPWIVRRLTGHWHRRHPRFVIVSQLLVAGWLVVLGALLGSIGEWAGVLLFVAAALLVWFIDLFRRSVQTWDASGCTP